MNRFSYRASLRRLLVTSMASSLAVTLTNCAAETLHDAAAGGQDGQIVTLLNAGQNINGRDIDGYTPLHWAAYNDKVSAAKVLVEHGANKEAKELNGMTPLIVAAYYNRLQVAWYLLQVGVDKEARDNKGWTALCYAASNRNVKMAQILIDKGAAVNPKTPDQLSPLMVAHNFGAEGVVSLLQKHGAKY